MADWGASPQTEQNVSAHEKESLEKRLSRQRSIVLFGALAVVGGLLLEVLLAYRFPQGASFMEKWGSTIATAIIAIGVLVETIWAKRGDATSDAIGALAEKATADANFLAAEANERAARTELLTAWRHVSKDKRSELIEFLRHLDIHVGLLLEYQTGDPEAFSYAVEIAKAFREAGIAVKGGSNSYLHAPMFGLHIDGKQEINFASIQVALENAGISVSGRVQESPLSRVLDSNVYIFVAPKLPPTFD